MVNFTCRTLDELKDELRISYEMGKIAIEQGKEYSGSRGIKDKNRSIQLNKYYHVVVNLYAIGYGYTLDEAKILLKLQCDFMSYEKNGMMFGKKSSLCTNKELSEFVEWIRNYAAITDGYYIPSAQEYLDKRYYYDKMIDSCKEYL
jgi:hypothetical protein